MTTNSTAFRPKLWVPGDWNAFFGLGTNVLLNVLVLSSLGLVFASLSPAISFALIGVIVGEFIGAERGIGRLIIESEARAEASGMMVAVIVLMLVGVALSAMIWRLQAHLLRWQQHNMVE